MPKIRAFLVASVVASAALVVGVHNASADAASEVNSRVEKLAQQKGAEFWLTVSEMEALGADAIPALTAALLRPEANVRLGVAKALYRCGEKKEAVAALVTMVGEKDRTVRRTAADLLADLTRDDANFGIRKDIESVLQDALDNADDQKFTIALARALYAVSSNIRAVDDLKKLLKAKDVEVRKDAALALAELNDFDLAMPVLKQIASEPGDKGALARLYLKHKELSDALMRNLGGNRADKKYAVLDEMIEMIMKNYVDASKADEAALIEGAAHGIAETLDPFSTYLNEKERQELTESINKQYGGIGAHVSTRDDVLTIERPVYDGPAYRAGLRSLDRVVEIEGMSTFKRPIDDCVTRLKGPAGTKVKFKVMRRGWTEARVFELERAQISIKTAQGDMLPGKIGLIQISSFGGDTNEDMRAALDKLLADGATGLIVDLRNNPGGLLTEVVQMVDRFVPAGQVLCTTKNRAGDKLEEFVSRDDDKIDLPVVVLINEGSASASEIMSGAMQDLKVATVVGERSYGKGSVQRIEPMKATRLKTAFKYTFAKYYLPSGRSIHLDRDRYGRIPEGAKGGVVPDIEVKLPERDLWKEFEFAKVLDSGALDTYLDEWYEKEKEALTKLATGTSVDPKSVPGFDKLYESLKTKAEPEEVCQLLRQHVRRRVSDDRKKEFLLDLQLDTQAQRAVVEVLKKTNVEPGSVDEYKSFAHAFDK
ncbi:MAG: hypothetical protein HYY18_22000 [Planctomycetes bacterium]|nr:hypothetical protein [Planctomycetota bacterium]